jgi:hypothetical protein
MRTMAYTKAAIYRQNTITEVTPNKTLQRQVVVIKASPKEFEAVYNELATTPGTKVVASNHVLLTNQDGSQELYYHIFVEVYK